MLIDPQDYEEAIAYLEAREAFGWKLGLERIEALLAALEHPQRSTANLRVAGTNGKSSTVLLLHRLLLAHDIPAGAYISPHLTDFRERFWLNEDPPEYEAFALLVDRVSKAVESVERVLADPVTQFEVLTAMAALGFARLGLSHGVWEAGLGARYDATAAVPCDVAVLTTVALDHTAQLGNTLEAIAAEKAHVAVPGMPLITGALAPALAEVVRSHTTRIDSPMYSLGRDFSIESTPGKPFTYRGFFKPLPDLSLSQPGSYQRDNAALALAAFEQWIGPPDSAAVQRAFSSFTLPGRLEVIPGSPLLILDGSHNPQGLQNSLADVRRLAGKRTTVGLVSIFADKEAQTMLGGLLRFCDALVLTSTANPRAMSGTELAGLLDEVGGKAVEVEEDPARALQRAKTLAGEQGAVLATGSLYFVGDLKLLLKNREA